MSISEPSVPRSRLPGQPLQDTGVQGIEKLRWADSLKKLRRNIPTALDWMTFTTALQTGRAQTVEEMAIRSAIESYHAGHARTFDNYNTLRNLYRCIEGWYELGNRDAAMEKQVDELHQAVVYQLCQFYEVSVNVLPRKLAEADRHMSYTHAGEGNLRKERPQLDEHRLVITHGEVTLWNDIDKRRTAVTSSVAALRADGGENVPRICQCDAGFVLSIWDEFYMAKHDGNQFYHSQYMAGHVVRCAGEMTVVGGVVRKVSNISGHYRPQIRHFLPVLYQLRLRGVDLSRVIAIARQEDDIFVAKASDMLDRTSVCTGAGDRSSLQIARFRDDGANWKPF